VQRDLCGALHDDFGARRHLGRSQTRLSCQRKSLRNPVGRLINTVVQSFSNNRQIITNTNMFTNYSLGQYYKLASFTDISDTGLT
jgi:hypothetical protein